jgi:hypothetical protein
MELVRITSLNGRSVHHVDWKAHGAQDNTRVNILVTAYGHPPVKQCDHPDRKNLPSVERFV